MNDNFDMRSVVGKFITNPQVPHLTSHLVSYKMLDEQSSLSKIVNDRINKSDAKFWRFLHDHINSITLTNSVISILDGRRVRVNGIECTDYSSCSYLGLDKHPYMIECAKQALEKYGTHFATSRIFSTPENVIKLEEEISSLVGSEKSLVGVNCHQMHQGVISTLFGSPHATIFRDKYAHMTMIEAAAVAKNKGAKVVKVDSQKLAELEEIFAKTETTKNVLLVDGMYSMSGIVLDLESIQEICDRHGVVLYVDDAHGIGIYGDNGGGVVDHCRLSFENMILVGGLQKGLASHGAFVAGSASLIDLLRSANTTFFQYSGTLQPQTIECARAAIRLVTSEEGKNLRSNLLAESEAVRNELARLGFDVIEAYSPIISVRIAGSLDAIIGGRYLLSHGVFVNSVTYPAVPKESGILRICLSAIHSKEDLKKLFEGFAMLADFLRSKEMSELKDSIANELKKLS